MQKIIDNAKRQIMALIGQEVEIIVNIISPKGRLTNDDIVNACAVSCNVNRRLVFGKTRLRKAIDCRKLITYFLRLKRAMPDEAIAHFLKKDRTSIIHYRRCIAAMISINDEYFLKKIDEVNKILPL